jgi:hypothetical protein
MSGSLIKPKQSTCNYVGKSSGSLQKAMHFDDAMASNTLQIPTAAAFMLCRFFELLLCPLRCLSACARRSAASRCEVSVLRYVVLFCAVLCYAVLCSSCQRCRLAAGWQRAKAYPGEHCRCVVTAAAAAAAQI